MSIVTIDVTQDDIDNGARGNARECPIARALDRTFPLEPLPEDATPGLAHWWSVTWFVKRYVKGEVTVVASLPPAANEFVSRFDHDSEVEPFSFDLVVPDELAAEVTS